MLKSFPLVSEQVAAATAVLQDNFAVNPGAVRHIFMPYRICPLGAHIDHQGGHVLGRIVNSGTVLAYAPHPEPEIRLASINFDDPVTFPIGAQVKRDHWARYAQAAALAMNEDNTLTNGFVGVSSGTMLGAGLSSSAAVGLAYLQALADVNSISLTASDLVELDYQLEHTYLGLQNGILDQSTVLYGRENALVYIDTRSRQTRLIPDPPQAEDVGWLIVYSGVGRELTKSGGYNQSVAECREAAKRLSEDAEVLSDVSQEQFDEQAAEMPDNLRHRATHYFGEVTRVTDGVQAWPEGDVARFGSLMNASCASSIHEYGSGQEEVIALHQIVSAAPGVYGSRFSGGGYGGCVIGLVERAQAETAACEIMEAYGQMYPDMAERASVYLVEEGGAAL